MPRIILISFLLLVLVSVCLSQVPAAQGWEEFLIQQVSDKSLSWEQYNELRKHLVPEVISTPESPWAPFTTPVSLVVVFYLMDLRLKKLLGTWVSSFLKSQRPMIKEYLIEIHREVVDGKETKDKTTKGPNWLK